MKPYSQDLRARVVAAYVNREGTQSELARRFRVSTSFVQSVVSSYRRTGSLEPKPHGGGCQPALDARGLETVARLVAEHPGATLRELCEEFSRVAGYRPSRATMWRAMKRVGRRARAAPAR